jgi:hypothetical protein
MMSFNDPIFIKQSTNILEIACILRTPENEVMRTFILTKVDGAKMHNTMLKKSKK